MSGVQFVKSKADFQLYLSNNKYLIANFTASWCGPCQAIKPLVDDLYAEPLYGKLEIVRIDLDANQELATQYNVTAVPTFLFFENGEVVDTVRGASAKLKDSFEQLRAKADSDPTAIARAGNATTSAAPAPASSAALKEIVSFIPKGYSVLNDNVHFGDFEALNTQALNSNTSIKDVFDLSKPSTSVFSDADSQILLYVPLTHISKIYSILIKTKKPVQVSETTLLDEDDAEETQLPNLIKVWGNKLNILAFEDAAGDNAAPHIEKLSLPDEEGWYECRLKFVRFQNVQSLNLFFDGDDDDFHTVIDKIAIVGLGGEQKDQNIIDKLRGEDQ
ncbi:Thioredoxin-like protein 1 [Yamadazyma tenuis]|uniref:Thioredoxin-like protein n=1 Tax=Candida tenuis (strain ATCC 10573 / BCRC 21748 / CBS 615 / JCM 9827 / NBRC 10315 / NRRL Y-1498 / VKM Y-70) TaxID=590646 RepID=G3B3I7_CANTC|nr:thioredoxin-like protein [Yamadazyma tenuis ATCC 10573]EGV64170.1 thioredoxin-like protein [Yamadazyma tenuis ATCC 10573]WEJ96179.1 Thioredoxin-like protein 1 [Yamadazyma tenuis]